MDLWKKTETSEDRLTGGQKRVRVKTVDYNTVSFKERKLKIISNSKRKIL